MLSWHECRDNVGAVIAIPLKLLTNGVGRVLILIELERIVTSSHRIVLDSLILDVVGSLSFTNRGNVKGVAIREVLDDTDKLHSIQFVEEQFLDLARPKLRPNEKLCILVGKTSHELSPC